MVLPANAGVVVQHAERGIDDAGDCVFDDCSVEPLSEQSVRSTADEDLQLGVSFVAMRFARRRVPCDPELTSGPKD